jgi:hypothetical protein
LYSCKGFTAVVQNQSWKPGEAVIRKHLPVATVVKCEEVNKMMATDPVGRRINIAVLEAAASQKIRKLETPIEEGKLDKAMEGMKNITKKATIQPMRRKGKRWIKNALRKEKQPSQA